MYYYIMLKRLKSLKLCFARLYRAVESYCIP